MGKSALKRQRQRPDPASRPPHPVSKKQRKQLKRQAADADDADAAAQNDDDDDELHELSALGFDDAMAAGVAFEEMASLSGAVAAFQTAVKARPTDVRALSHLADVYAALEQHGAAVETYTRATALPAATADASLWFRCGLAHLALAQYAAADASLQTALTVSAAAIQDAADDELEAKDAHRKAYSVTLAALANSFGEQGDVNRAVALYRDAVARFPTDANLHYNLATMLLAKREAAAEEEDRLPITYEVLASLERAIACSPTTQTFYKDAIACAEAAADDANSTELVAKVTGWKCTLTELEAAESEEASEEASETSDDDDDVEDDAEDDNEEEEN